VDVGSYSIMDDPDTIFILTMAARGKAKAVARNRRCGFYVLAEKWPATYLQRSCDARIDATMESNPRRVMDSMMRLYEVMASKPMPETGCGSTPGGNRPATKGCNLFRPVSGIPVSALRLD